MIPEKITSSYFLGVHVDHYFGLGDIKGDIARPLTNEERLQSISIYNGVRLNHFYASIETQLLIWDETVLFPIGLALAYQVPNINLCLSQTLGYTLGERSSNILMNREEGRFYFNSYLSYYLPVNGKHRWGLKLSYRTQGAMGFSPRQIGPSPITEEAYRLRYQFLGLGIAYLLN